MSQTSPVTPYQAFADQSRARPGATFLLAPAAAELPYAPTGFRFSYAEAFARIEDLREAYRAAGYGHGASVALLLENRPDFFWHWLALNALGVAILPLNPDLRAEDLGYQIALVEPDLVVALREKQPLLRSACGPDLCVITPQDTPPPCRVRISRHHGESLDPCALLFTSGTTGKPKCCVLSNDYFMTLAR